MIHIAWRKNLLNNYTPTFLDWYFLTKFPNDG